MNGIAAGDLLKDLVEDLLEIFSNEDLFEHLAQSAVHQLIHDISALAADIDEDDLGDGGQMADFPIALIEKVGVDRIEDKPFDQDCFFRGRRGALILGFLSTGHNRCPIAGSPLWRLKFEADVDIVQGDFIDDDIFFQIVRQRSMDLDFMDRESMFQCKIAGVADLEIVDLDGA